MLTDISWSDILLKTNVVLSMDLKKSPLGVLSSDACLEKLFINSFIKKNDETNRIVLLGNEISEDMASNFFTADLFFQNEDILVLQAENIPLRSFEIISRSLKEKKKMEKMVYLFFAKECKISKDLNKLNDLFLQLNSPKFWEFEKVLDLLCKRFSLILKPEIKNYLLTSLSLDLAEHLRAVLSLIQEMKVKKEESLNLSQVKELFPQKRLDQFALAHLYGNKNFKLFFQKIVDSDLDFGELEDFFRFMQTHLLKVLDSKILSPKTKYEREIGQYRHLWKNEELIAGLSKFSKWQIMCKEKSWILNSAVNLEVLGPI